MRRLSVLLLLLAACGADEPAPPPNPVRERMAPARAAAEEAERAMQESADRMDAAADSAR